MTPFDRRRFLQRGLGATACACLTPRLALAETSGSGLYICPPCGCAMDGKDFTAPGVCPACQMTLIPKPVDAPVTDATLLTPDIIHSDFDALYAGLQQAHYDLYARRNRADYEALFQSMRREFTAPMSRLQVQVAFQRFVAYGRVAHAHMDFPQAAFDSYRSAGGRYLPLGIRIVDRRMFIAQNYSGRSDIKVGAEILAIDDQPAEKVLEAFGRHISADTDYLSSALIEQRLSALVWLEWGPRPDFKLDLDDHRQIIVAARTRDEVRSAAKSQPDRFAPDGYSRAVRLIGNVAYLRPGPFMNSDDGLPWDTTSFAAFIDQSFECFLQAKAECLIIDLRANPGGDAIFSNRLISWIADRPFQFYASFRLKASAASRARTAQQLKAYADQPDSYAYQLLKQMSEAMAQHTDGETFAFDIPKGLPRSGQRFAGQVRVLTDCQTFSNATAVAALIQDYGFGRIAGEATADLPSSYGASETFALPGSGLSVSYPKSFFVRPNGDARIRGVMPDDPIPSPIIEGSEDSMLATCIALMSRQAKGL